MYRLQRIIVWIMRMHCCRGFGIQSPSDYAFVRYVVNEHYPYYSYSDLKSLLPDVGDRARKLYCLYFRIANFLQPDVIVGYSADEALKAYLHAGCKRVVIMNDSDESAYLHGRTALFVASLCDAGFEQMVSRTLDVASERSILVVEGIHRSNEAKARWRAIQADERAGVTFDLYYAGIVFFDRKRHKQSYKINF